MAKILLVEDDNNLREIYEARLQAEGYDIVSAADGEAALVVAQREKPDLIISDVMMPQLSGFEMLDIIRNTETLKHVKVIMLTALGQAEDKSRADNLGADRYLVKSQVTLEDIVKAAADLLSDKNTVQAAAAGTAPAAAPVTVAAPAAIPVAEPPQAASQQPTAPTAAPAPAAQTAPPPQPAPAQPAPAAAAPGVAPTTTSDNTLVADAVQGLISGAAPQPATPAAPSPPPAAAPAPPTAAPATPQPVVTPPPAPAPAPVPIVPAPAPAMPPPTPAPTPSPTPIPPAQSTVDSVTLSGKKVIKPLEDAEAAKPPDLNELLYKEGITDLDEQPAQPLPPHTDAMPHPPGHVISPNPVNATGQPIDPNSISL